MKMLTSLTDAEDAVAEVAAVVELIEAPREVLDNSNPETRVER